MVATELRLLSLRAPGVVAGRRQVEAADARLLEGRGGVIGRVRRAAEHRGRLRHLEAVIGGDVEHLLLSPVRHRAGARVAVPGEELRVVLRGVLREVVHHRPRAGALLRVAAEREAELRLLRDLLGDAEHLGLVGLHLLGAVLPELRGAARIAETVVHPPGVFVLADGVVVGGRLQVEGGGQEGGQALVRRTRGRACGRERRLDRRREGPRPDVLLGEGGKRRLEIGHVGLRAGDAVALDQAPVRDVPRRLAGEEVGLGRLHVGRHRLDPLHHQRPLVLGAQQSVAGVRHSLDLPVDAAERLGHVGVDAPLLVAPLGQLVHHVSRLRLDHGAVDPCLRGERPRGDGLERGDDRLQERHFGLHGGRAVVAQPAVGRRQRRVVPVAAEVGGGDRIELERLEEVPLPHGDERGVVGARGGLRTAGGERAQHPEGSHPFGGAVDERAAVHDGSWMGGGRCNLSPPNPFPKAGGTTSFGPRFTGRSAVW